MSVNNLSGVNNVATTGLSAQAASLDPEVLMMAIISERQDSLDAVVKGQAAEMNQRNAQIKELNNALQTLRAMQNTGKDAANSSAAAADQAALAGAYNTLMKYGIDLPSGMSRVSNWVVTDKVNGFNHPAADISKYNPVRFTSLQVNGTKEQWAAWVENTKTEIDSLSSNSQMDMIKLQGAINKMNQNIEMLSNLMAKFAKTMDSIVGNMR